MSAGLDVFKRPRDFDDRALGVSLRPYEWEVLLALDGRTPLMQLLRQMGLADIDADEVADELTGKGLMQPCVVTFGEFMRERDGHEPQPPHTPTPPPPSISFKEAPPAIVAKPPPPQIATPSVASDIVEPATTPIASMPPLAASSSTILPSVPASTQAPPPSVPGPVPPPPAVAMKSPSTPSIPNGGNPRPVISATIKPPPPRLSFSVKPERPKPTALPSKPPLTPQVAVGISGFKLKPLFDFIVEQAGGSALPRIAAQLAVYRVFRRVPRELMVADNIHSFSIGDPTIEVHNKQLYDAIVRAIEATFGVTYDAGQADRAAG